MMNYNMTNEQKEAFDAVNKINDELYKKYGKKDTLPMLSISLANEMFFISLCIPSEIYLPEIQLYHSVNDDRIYYEKSDKYETFYKLIKRKFLQVKSELNAIKL